MSQSLPTQLKVHRAISEIPEAAWNALVDEEAAPFLEWRWLEALECERERGPRLGLGAAAPHALARAPPGRGRAGLPQGGQQRRVRLRLLLGHRRPSGPGCPTTRSWSSPRRSPPPPGVASWSPPGRTGPRGCWSWPRARWSSPARSACRASTCSSRPRSRPWRSSRSASPSARGCSTTSSTRATARPRTCSSASPASGGTSSGASAAPRPSRGSRSASSGARPWPRPTRRRPSGSTPAPWTSSPGGAAT